MQDTIVSTAKAGRPVWAYFNKDIHMPTPSTMLRR